MEDKVIELRVCVGSSCHLKGGTETLKAFEALIDREHVSDKIVLKADLCLDNCLEAPNIVLDDCVYGGITPERVSAFFEETVLPMVKK